MAPIRKIKAIDWLDVAGDSGNFGPNKKIVIGGGWNKQ